MNNELKQLIEDAANLLGVFYDPYYGGRTDAEGFHPPFDPRDPERGEDVRYVGRTKTGKARYSWMRRIAPWAIYMPNASVNGGRLDRDVM